jgi:Gas vesicle synthesis protein GvpL/GvpF
MTRKYVYGIIEEQKIKNFDFFGIEGAPVYTINCRQLAAVVSDVEITEIDPTRRNVLAHTLAQDSILKLYTLVPMGFGMVAANETAVLNILEKNYVGLTAELKRLAGKIEAELKVFWDDNALTVANRQLIEKVQAKVKASSSAVETQKILSEAGMQVEKVVISWKGQYADRIYAALRKLAVDSRLNDCSGVKMLLNASFLIERQNELAFLEQIRNLDAEFQGNINCKYIGPLSPYNFVSLKLEQVN